MEVRLRIHGETETRKELDAVQRDADEHRRLDQLGPVRGRREHRPQREGRCGNQELVKRRQTCIRYSAPYRRSRSPDTEPDEGDCRRCRSS